MRQLNPQPKARREVPLPADLREALRGARDLIRRAPDDPDIAIDYDDAIQFPGLCGGRIGPDARPYEFTYYPPDDNRHGLWRLALDESEIEAIADGAMTEISMYCCTSPECRAKFRDPEESCFECDYDDAAELRRHQARLDALAPTVTSKSEWVAGYLAIRPDAGVFDLIGDYNGTDNLGERLGWFPTREAEQLIEEACGRR